ncbi:hypothetical protein BC831DRAFT_446133 [Entophlyctis helioformis]|nr:hypothetical protein BC831DRAFT_446133 [Entophlyctis helioformis]
MAAPQTDSAMLQLGRSSGVGGTGGSGRQAAGSGGGGGSGGSAGQDAADLSPRQVTGSAADDLQLPSDGLDGSDDIDSSSHREQDPEDFVKAKAMFALFLRPETVFWGRIKGYPWWPCKPILNEAALAPDVLKARPSRSNHHLPIYFFGSRDFAWLPPSVLKPFEPNKEKYADKSKMKQFLLGVKEAQDPSLWPKFMIIATSVPKSGFHPTRSLSNIQSRDMSSDRDTDQDKDASTDEDEDEDRDQRNSRQPARDRRQDRGREQTDEYHVSNGKSTARNGQHRSSQAGDLSNDQQQPQRQSFERHQKRLGSSEESEMEARDSDKLPKDHQRVAATDNASALHRQSLPANARSEQPGALLPTHDKKKRRTSEPTQPENASKKRRKPEMLVGGTDAKSLAGDSIAPKTLAKDSHTIKSKRPAKDDKADSRQAVQEPGPSQQDHLMYLRVKLQRFMQNSEARKVSDLETADRCLKLVEAFDVTFELFKATKIGKLIKHMSRMQLNPDTFHIVPRCHALLVLWKAKLATPPIASQTSIPQDRHGASIEPPQVLVGSAATGAETGRPSSESVSPMREATMLTNRMGSVADSPSKPGQARGSIAVFPAEENAVLHAMTGHGPVPAAAETGSRSRDMPMADGMAC